MVPSSALHSGLLVIPNNELPSILEVIMAQPLLQNRELLGINALVYRRNSGLHLGARWKMITHMCGKLGLPWLSRNFEYLTSLGLSSDFVRRAQRLLDTVFQTRVT